MRETSSTACAHHRFARKSTQSLRRLQTERIDLYQIHWPAWPASPEGHDPGTIEEAWSTMLALRDEGKVAFVGVSNFDVAQLQRISRIETPTNLQPPYSMLRPEIEADLLPYCAEHNIGVIPYSPMQSGLLTGTMTRERVASLPANDFRREAGSFRNRCSRSRSDRRAAPCRWRETRPHSRRGGYCVDAEAPCHYRDDRRRAKARADRSTDRRGHVSIEPEKR